MSEPKIGRERKKPGPPKGVRVGGRQKGTPNVLTATLKDMILQALSDAGGVTYLSKQAEESPAAFLTLVGKVLPLQVTGDAKAPLEVSIRLIG